MKNVVVIGGGAAGLMAASSAAFVIKDTKHTVTVIEKNSRPFFTLLYYFTIKISKSKQIK